MVDYGYFLGVMVWVCDRFFWLYGRVFRLGSKIWVEVVWVLGEIYAIMWMVVEDWGFLEWVGRIFDYGDGWFFWWEWWDFIFQLFVKY
jgi:hypothetical protein